MIAILLFFLADPSVVKGDHWTTERTMRLIQDTDHIDQRSVDKLDYLVESSDPEGFEVAIKVTPETGSTSKASTYRYAFTTNGLLLNKEDATDPNVERMNRMIWTSLEDRKGLAWARTWPAIGGLLGGNVLVKPTSRTRDDVTYAVTYIESGKSKCAATIKLFSAARIVEDLALSINDVDIPGYIKHGSLIVTEKMKEIHLRAR